MYPRIDAFEIKNVKYNVKKEELVWPKLSFNLYNFPFRKLLPLEINSPLPVCKEKRQTIGCYVFSFIDLNQRRDISKWRISFSENLQGTL